MKRAAAAVMEIVGERGMYQDPVLGSGGMLVGTVEMIGTDLEGAIDLQTGTRIATMVSLTATPLKIDRGRRINMATDQVWVEGKAVLFEKGIFARLPDDLPDPISLAVMDVAGAPAMVARMVNAGDVVLVMGGGKAGLLCLHEARKRTGVTGRTHRRRILGGPLPCEIEELGLADRRGAGGRHPARGGHGDHPAPHHGRMADFTINVVTSKTRKWPAS
jgi:L-erythro-3,5-diaminohexanoate dehydrogenase